MTVAREGIKYQREKTKTKTNDSVNNLEKKARGTFRANPYRHLCLFGNHQAGNSKEMI